jgi:hypothetical protein
MGSLCDKKTQDPNAYTKQSNEKKVFRENEIRFWEELESTKLIKIAKLTKKTVEFNYSNLFIENYVSVSQILERLFEEENFIYFPCIFEIVIAIIDFLQIVLHYKQKHHLDYFFLINFDKFYLEKTSGKYFNRLVYLESKLNEHYNAPEIIVKEDNNLMSSFSMSLDPGMNTSVGLLSHQNNNNNGADSLYDATQTDIDANSYFYSKCNNRYHALRANFSLEECEKFYAENILNFLTKFLMKKTSMANGANNLEHDFQNFKYIFRQTISYYYKFENKYFNLQQLKTLMMNFYLNNSEFTNIKTSITRLIEDDNGRDKELTEKIILFNKSDICLTHGDCDIQKTDKCTHKIAFMYDKIVRKEEYSFCCNCLKELIMQMAPEGRDDMIPLTRFEEQLAKNANINIGAYFIYFCLNSSLEAKREYVNIYKKNQNNLTFEIVEWDEYKETVLSNEILNLDFIAKTKVDKVDKKNNKLIPNKK